MPWLPCITALFLASIVPVSTFAQEPTESVSQAPTVRRPNVIVIVSDDQGFGDIQWHDPEVKTPNLMKLARDGVTFERFYANPICSMTRAALMTGVATTRTRVNNSSGLDLNYRLLPEVFHDAGYQTWMCGKWHLGGSPDSERNGPEFLPHARGFDHFYGHLHGAVDYYTHFRKDRNELDWQRNGTPIEEEGFSTHLLANEAIGLIEQRDTERPFFLYLAFNAVHGPLQATPDNPNVSRRDRRQLLVDNIQSFDDSVGKVLECLEQQGLADSTIVWYFSDNGGQLSQGSSNGDLRDQKGTTYEGGIRVPSAVRWPGVLPERTTSQQFICVTDLLPTLCHACSIEQGLPQGIDGVDLWEAVKDNQPVEHTPFVMGGQSLAGFMPPWKLVIPDRGGTPELFHIVDDPNETTDLSAENPEIVLKLSEHIRSLGGDTGGRNRNRRRNQASPGGAPTTERPRRNANAIDSRDE